nr:hypothetical protein [Spirochaetota bacterium]
MSFIRKYQYSNVGQRKVFEYNYLFSNILLGLFFTDLYFTLTYYCFYLPVVTFLIVLGFGGIIAGTLLGKLLYSRYGKFR